MVGIMAITVTVGGNRHKLEFHVLPMAADIRNCVYSANAGGFFRGEPGENNS